MKITKKAKRVDVMFREIVSEITSYQCPSCHTMFVGAGIRRNITKFTCSCGQSLIVNKFISEAKRD